MSKDIPDKNFALSDDELNALEASLASSLEEVKLGEDTLLPPLQAYQKARRQRQRHRPEVARKPSDSYHHGNLRQSLIAIAMEQAEKQGLSKVSLRGIAREAGVSAPALYRHFKDKEALLAAVAEHGFAELEAWLEFAAPAELLFPTRIQRLFLAYLEFMQAYPLYYQLMFGSEIQERQLYPELVQAQENMLKPLVSLILAGRHEGQVRSDIEAEAQVLQCWSSLHGFTSLVVMGVIQGSPAELQAQIDTLLKSLMSGLQAQA